MMDLFLQFCERFSFPKYFTKKEVTEDFKWSHLALYSFFLPIDTTFTFQFHFKHTLRAQTLHFTSLDTQNHISNGKEEINSVKYYFGKLER